MLFLRLLLLLLLLLIGANLSVSFFVFLRTFSLYVCFVSGAERVMISGKPRLLSPFCVAWQWRRGENDEGEM